MGLFGSKEKKKISQLEKENILYKEVNRSYKKRIDQLTDLCEEKDSFFKELMSDALRHGSPLAGKHMADRKKYKNGK